MDSTIMQLIKENTPVMNEKVVRGYVNHAMDYSLEFIDKILKWAYVNMLEQCGISYDGYDICTPKEEFEESSRLRNAKRSVNVGESSIFMIKLFFTYRGEKLPAHFVYVPFVEEGGSIYLGGSRYFLHPILANKVISSTDKGIFVKMLKDRANFERLWYNVIADDRIYRASVITAPLYRKEARLNKNIKDTTKANPTALHYILCKYGLDKFFKKFYGFIPAYGDHNSVNESTYHPDKYVIFDSIKVKPKTYMDGFYNPTTVRFAVPRELVNHDLINTIATLFYIIDHFPDRLIPESLKKPILWIITLGHINFSGVYDEKDLHTKMMEHFVSLDDYMDNLLKEKLLATGYDCEDTYDLLFFTKRDFAIWHTKSDTISSMYNKELDVLESALFFLIKRIFKSSYEIKKKMNNKKDLSKNEIIDIIRKFINTGAVFKLTDTKANRHNNILGIQYSGDNMFFKITSTIVPQEGRTSNKGGSKVSLEDPNNKLHASYAECGGYLAITQSQPIGNGKLNPYIGVDNTGTIVRNIEFEELIDKVQKMLTHSRSR